jgi:hypothetical protein
MEVAAAVLAIAAALAPVFVNWLQGALDEPAPKDALAERHNQEADALHRAVRAGDANAVAAAFARRDRLLRRSGIEGGD